jgi:hypothetical protein
MNTEARSTLHCRTCGNEGYFIEVMEHVENLIDGGRNHLHLLIGVPDYYQCKQCGERIDWDEIG